MSIGGGDVEGASEEVAANKDGTDGFGRYGGDGGT